MVYSATKHIDGQGRCLDGAILGTAKYINEVLNPVHYPTLENFPQMELPRRQMKSGGTMVSLDFKGKESSFRFLNALKLVLISNNLGDSKSLATHPATTTHQRLSPEQKAAQGITPDAIRLSVGLEDVGDLLADVHQALDEA